MKPIFIIPARGGSKGIPGKNIADLAGRPLIAYTIDAAREALALLNSEETASATTSHRVENPLSDMRRIIVSTDSAEIADCARKDGVEIPFLRPAALSTDTAGSREVILHAMDYADSKGISYDCVILLQPTSPMRKGHHIAEAARLFDPSRCDMVVSVCQASANPYYNCFETDPEQGYLHISKGDGLLTRRQDAPPAWEYNGAIYIIAPDSIRQMPLGAFPRRIPYEMAAIDSLDIDTPLDLTVARAVMEHLKNQNARQ